MAVKLTGFSFGTTPRLPGLRVSDITSVECDNPAAPLKDWKVVIRGQSVFFISPPGWNNATKTSPQDRDPRGPVVVHQIQLKDVHLHWSSDESDPDVISKATSKYDSMPLGWKPAPIVCDKPILAQIPAGQTGDA
jgi:hypothetical protein